MSRYYQPSDKEALPVLADENNPFDRTKYEPDLNDFKMPYQLYGNNDLALVQAKYLKLHNQSYAMFVRLGIP